VACASILHEVPQEGGNQEPATDYHEEQEASYTGCMPQLWNQGFQDREELDRLLSYF
jgi:hypothetical protein